MYGKEQYNMVGCFGDGLVTGIRLRLQAHPRIIHTHIYNKQNSFALDIASLVLAMVVHEYRVLPPTPPEVST